MKKEFFFAALSALASTISASAEPDATSAAPTWPALPTPENYIAPRGVPDVPWLGVNASHYDGIEKELNSWGVKTVRVNWGWNAPGAPGGNEIQKYSPEKLRHFVKDGFHFAAGVNPRGVDFNGKPIQDDNFETWVANYKNYARTAMQRFGAPGDVLIRSYICGNEPDINDHNTGTGNLTPYQSVRLTRALWEAKMEVNPALEIESSPVSRPDVEYLRDMIYLGVANWCDVIGIHAYANQMDDARFRKPWEWLQAAGVKKPISISESGVPLRTDWGPKEITDVQWREKWHALAYLQSKRFGYDKLLLFTHTGGDNWVDQWAYLDRNKSLAPIETAYSEVKYGMNKRRWKNSGFEEPNDRRHQWIPIQPINDPKEVAWVNFSDTQKRSGKASLKIENGPEARWVKRIVPDLKVGQTYVITARAKVTGAGTAILAAQGYNRTAGAEEKSASSSSQDGWRKLQVRFTPSNPWVVVALGAGPAANGAVNWDDIAVRPAS